MAKYDPNEPPPPYYSVAMHTQPPLKPHEGVVYGVGPGLVPPSQPHYIPRYGPPSVVPQVTRSSTPPSGKRRGCCQNNSKCYGGSGGTLLVLALLGLAIWLGVRYGTRLAAIGILYGDDNIKEEENLPPPKADTCSNNTIQCDAIQDCTLGSDETNCMRFGEGGRLQVRTSADGRFLPVCFKGWERSFAEQTCAQLGFRGSPVTEAIKSQDSVGLTMTSRTQPYTPIHGLVKVSPSCPDQETVSLRCTDCGRQQSTSRIIGGSAAKRGQWPWQVSLHYKDSHFCGAVLIAPDYALTAAHCVQWSGETLLSAKLLKLYAGFVSQDSLPKPYLIQKIMVHDNYNTKTHDRDIALLKLTTPVRFNDAVQPACLPASDQELPPGSQCWISGFGTTESGPRISKDLLEVTVDIISTQVCNSRSVYGGLITKNMLCAGDLQGGKDSCQGDSGGPLVCQAQDRWYVMGITSWGEACGKKNKPGVYAKVHSLLPWIYSTMQQDNL